MNERVCHRRQLHGRDHRVESASRRGVGARGSRSRSRGSERERNGSIRTPQRGHVVPTLDGVLNQLHDAVSGASFGVPVERLREIPEEHRLRRVRPFIRHEPGFVLVDPVVDLDVAGQSHLGVSREGHVGVRPQDRRLRRGDKAVLPGNDSPQPRDRHQVGGVQPLEPVRPQVVARRPVGPVPVIPMTRGVYQALGQQRAVRRLLLGIGIIRLWSLSIPFLGTKRHSLRGVAAAISEREAGPTQRHPPRGSHHFVGSHALREREGRGVAGVQREQRDVLAHGALVLPALFRLFPRRQARMALGVAQQPQHVVLVPSIGLTAVLSAPSERREDSFRPLARDGAGAGTFGEEALALEQFFNLGVRREWLRPPRIGLVLARRRFASA